MSPATGLAGRRLQGRVAVVTGGTSGIGRAAACALARESAQVVLVGRDPERLERVAVEVGASGVAGRALALRLDVGRDDDMETMRATVLERCERIDVLVAAAGIQGPADRRLPTTVATMSVEDWDAVLRTNLRGVFLSNRAVIPAMLRQRSGTIINIASSRGGLYGNAYAAAYCASKFGVIGLTESLAEELGPHGIRVTAVLPDVVDTPILGELGRAMLGPSIPPERVAQLVVQLVTMPEDVQLLQPLIAPMMNPGRPFGIPAGRYVPRRAALGR